MNINPVKNNIRPVNIKAAEVKQKPAAPLPIKPDEENNGTAGEKNLSVENPTPILYANEFNVDLYLSILEQKMEIIEKIQNSFKQTEDDKIEEERLEDKLFWKKVDTKKALEKASRAAVRAKKAIEGIQTILALLKTPTSNPKARMSMAAAELTKISGQVLALIGEVKGAISSVSQLEGNQNKMLKSLSALGEALESIYATCGKVKKELES
ncbi:MAG: hypothetical protein FD145_725 [Candidatus Saganbacteria bacterium]|uniref:Uncharacterized protein n=1 Tax=Candidatus Saganbacteria bacterium TaxID=2575572 RepID=A0A833L1A1_UNCSA|nr:MAG: hypothetical protein FD145_725 [Candidatus Saganbacteria bacterium]